MIDELPKHIEYRGVRFILKKSDGGYGYRLSRRIEGIGYQSEALARKAAKAAIDRMLAREKAKA